MQTGSVFVLSSLSRISLFRRSTMIFLMWTSLPSYAMASSSTEKWSVDMVFVQLTRQASFIIWKPTLEKMMHWAHYCRHHAIAQYMNLNLLFIQRWNAVADKRNSNRFTGLRVIAEIVSERLKRIVMSSYRPRFWAWYIDNTFVIIDR